MQFPITDNLSLAGDGGTPLVAIMVVSDPTGPVATAFSKLGVAVVREVAKLRSVRRNSHRYDSALAALVASLPAGAAGSSGAAGGSDGGEGVSFLLHLAVVRSVDTSARSINECTGETILRDEVIAEDVVPQDVQPLGNYAVQVS